MAGQKRVACFYRVSLKNQATGDDIPMQKNACRNFSEEKGWRIVKEYKEAGVSGYKVSADDRDEIQRAKRDAENGEFDVLLCFMFDRLGRKEDETPFVVKWFSKQNVEIWSVKEGQQKFEDHSDDLINFIRYWQSSGESKKTSMRVTENHEQMVVNGIYRGGRPPYGYELIPSGVENKKGKELMKLSMHEDESKVIQEIFNLVYHEGYGTGRISKYLNQQSRKNSKYQPRHQGAWNSGVINYILKNPIYKGFMRFKKDNGETVLSEQQNEEIAIIESDIWNEVQRIRGTKSVPNSKTNDEATLRVSKSPLLFVGRINCGHCGSPLTTTYNTTYYTTKDGEKHKTRSPKYRCSGKALYKKECDGQTIYSHKKIDNAVLRQIKIYLEDLKKVDFEKEIQKHNEADLKHTKEQLQSKNDEMQKAYQSLSTLKNEVTKSITGDSEFKPELLNELIENKEKEIDSLNNELTSLEKNLEEEKGELNNIYELQKTIPVWEEEFEKASNEKRKMMLSYLVENVVVTRDSIELDVKLNIEQFIKSSKSKGDDNLTSSASDTVGRATIPKTLPIKILEEKYHLSFAS